MLSLSLYNISLKKKKEKKKEKKKSTALQLQKYSNHAHNYADVIQKEVILHQLARSSICAIMLSELLLAMFCNTDK